jgi:hypothetical protein
MYAFTHQARDHAGSGRAASGDISLEHVAARLADMPEKRLMLAVLMDAIVQLRRHGSAGAIEAAAWIRGDGTEGASAFSFTAVCEALGLDPSYLARGVFRWADEVEPRDDAMTAARLRRPQPRALRMSARTRRERSVAAAR